MDKRECIRLLPLKTLTKPAERSHPSQYFSFLSLLLLLLLLLPFHLSFSLRFFDISVHFPFSTFLFVRGRIFRGKHGRSPPISLGCQAIINLHGQLPSENDRLEFQIGPVKKFARIRGGGGVDNHPLRLDSRGKEGTSQRPVDTFTMS